MLWNKLSGDGNEEKHKLMGFKSPEVLNPETERLGFPFSSFSKQPFLSSLLPTTDVWERTAEAAGPPGGGEGEMSF